MEGDYWYQAWFLVIKILLFSTNGSSNSRLGESVYEDFTQEKPTPYNTYGNILRYIRCSSELKELGFDLCNIEVCLPGTDEAKVFHDQFKLLIKGRPYTTSLYNLYPHIFNNIDS
jgi:hypothetical protein